jgi:uncharacterized protein (TIGR00251 family)
MATLQIRVTPRAGKNRVAVDGGKVRVWVTAPPTDGQANDAIVKFLAKSLGLAPSKLAIIRGESGRDKTVLVEELNLDDVLHRLSQTKR